MEGKHKSLNLFDTEFVYFNKKVRNFKPINCGSNGQVFKCDVVERGKAKKIRAAKIINVSDVNQFMKVKNEVSILKRINHFFGSFFYDLLDDDPYVKTTKNHALYICVLPKRQIP